MEHYQSMSKNKYNSYQGFIKQNPLHNYKYSIYNSNYNEFLIGLLLRLIIFFKQDNYDKLAGKYKFYINKNKNTTNMQEIFVVLGILETMGLVMYESSGGDTPQIYIHVNSRYQLQKVLDAPQNYKNSVLENVHYRHDISSKMLMYLFKMKWIQRDFGMI